jgi:hypothetical protein
MKKYIVMFICLSALFLVTVCPNVSGADEDLKAKVEAMEKMLMELKGQLAQQAETTKELESLRDDVKGIMPGNEFYWAQRAQELQDKGLAPYFGKQGTKPFLSKFGRNTYVGGYMDHELTFSENGQNTFKQHRLIPFIYSDVSDRVKFATEIEIEYGGPQTSDGVFAGAQKGELKVEFATIDFLMTDWINYRAGIILSPLGKFNLVHDSPLQDLTERPMVSKKIIPSTLSESGMGFFGTLYPTEMSTLSYEIYAVNGFMSAKDGTVVGSGESFISNSKGSQKADNNTNPAIVGRLAYSPFLGLELGASFHTGTIDDHGSNRMTIKALDWTYQRGPFELVGEYAHASIERDGRLTSDIENSAEYNGDMWGYYIEPRYHFMPQFLQDLAPTFFTEDSTFTGVVRLGGLDINQPLPSGGVPSPGAIKKTRLTPGVNFRYTEDTVFKAEYQVNWEAGRRGTTHEVSNNVLLFSVATYF